MVALLCGVTIAAVAQQPSYTQLMSQGISLLRQGKIDQALAAYEQAVQVAGSPAQRAQALLGKARVLRLNSRYRDSVAAYREALKLSGITEYQKLEAWRGLAWAAGALKDVKLQVEANQALAESPRASEAEKAMALGRLAGLWRDEGDKDKAAEYFWRVLENYPRQPEAVRSALSLVELYSRKGDWAGVDRVLAWARQHRPENIETLYVRAAEMAASRRKLTKALMLLDELIALKPYSAIGWQRAWELHRAKGDAEQFLARAREKARQDPRVAEGLVGIADSLAARGEAGDAEGAVELYLQLLPLVADASTAKIGGALAALRAGRLDLAEQWSSEALAAHPHDTRAQNVRARVLVQQGKKSEAFELLKRVANYKPGDASSAQRLQAMLTSTGLGQFTPQVVAEVRRATGDSRALALALAQYYRLQGQWAKAVDELGRALASGQAAPGYAASLLRSWLSDATERPALLDALRQLDRQGKLPQDFLPAAAYGCLLSGSSEEGKGLLSRLPDEKRSGEVMRVVQWLEFAGRSDLARSLYPLVLAGPVAPTAEMQMAMTVADDLAQQGRLREAAETLRQHRKPAMPDALAVPYDLALASVLVGLGRVDEAEVLLSNLARSERSPKEKVTVLLAECAFRRGDYARARELLKSFGPPEKNKASDTAEQKWSNGEPPGPLGGTNFVAPWIDRDQESQGRALFLLAGMDLREGRLDDAEKGFNRVVKLAPASTAATQAVQQLMTLMELRRLSDEERQRFTQGLRALDRGDYPAASEALKPWLDSADNPLADDARLLVAEAQAGTDPEGAAKAFETLAQTMPDSPLAAYALYRAAVLRAPLAPADALRLARAVQQQYSASALAPLAGRLADELARQQAP